MLKLFAYDTENNELELDGIVSLSYNSEENVPADDLCVRLSVSPSLPELARVRLVEDGNALFTGVVDEQQNCISESEVYTTITARSLAALLLDNESEPVSYYYPTSAVIFERHLKPCGITSYKGYDSFLRDRLNIPKGCTNWHALALYCKRALGTVPRVTGDGTVDFMGIQSKESLVFSSERGIGYSSVKENLRRCKPLSDVLVKLPNSSGYNFDIENTEAKSRKIKRVRYLDVSCGSSAGTADIMISNSERSSYEIELITPERLIGSVGAAAELFDPILGERKGLLVSSVYYSLSPKGGYSVIKLRKDKNNVDS